MDLSNYLQDDLYNPDEYEEEKYDKVVYSLKFLNFIGNQAEKNSNKTKIA